MKNVCEANLLRTILERLQVRNSARRAWCLLTPGRSRIGTSLLVCRVNKVDEPEVVCQLLMPIWRTPLLSSASAKRPKVSQNNERNGDKMCTSRIGRMLGFEAK